MRKAIVFLRKRIPLQITFQTLLRMCDRAIARRSPFVLKKFTGTGDDLLLVEMESTDVAATMPVGEVAIVVGEAATTWAAKTIGLVRHGREDPLLGMTKRFTTIVGVGRIRNRPGARVLTKRVAAATRTMIEPWVVVMRTPVQHVGVAMNTGTVRRTTRATTTPNIVHVQPWITAVGERCRSG